MEQMKRVNVIASRPIYEVNPPIRGRARNIKLSIADIRKCIMARAKVEEVLRDGSTVILHLGNYNKDNQPPKKEKVIEEPVIEETVEEPEEVIESEDTTEDVVVEEIPEDIEIIEPEEVIEDDEVVEEESTVVIEETDENDTKENYYGSEQQE